MSKVTKDTIKHIAKLAKLEFEDAELEKFEKEFNSILDYVTMIQECDTNGIEFEHNISDYQGDVLQEDVVKPSMPTDKALMNATDGRTKFKYIRTSKIVNKE